MKKKLLVLLILVFLSNGCADVFAASSSSSLKIAIKKYRRGNYTGCLQDCQRIVGNNPRNSTAYYYMAMAYVQAGKKDEAIKAYSKVLSLKPNALLRQYATTGKTCLETPDKCTSSQVSAGQSSDLDRFISKPSADGLSPAVRNDFQQKHLNNLKYQMNTDKELDDYNFSRFNHSSKVENENELIAKKPTDAEIKSALKVLSDAGMYPENNSYSAPSQPEQNPELMQLNALFGGNNQSNNNSMTNMIPYMLQQSKNGNSNYSPQMM